MKTKNLLFAGAIALSTVMSPMAAMISATPVFANSYTVENKTQHDYEAYQIFRGTQGTDVALGNIEWGTGVDAAKMLDGLSKSKTFSKNGVAMSAKEVAAVLEGTSDKSAEAVEFAKIADAARSETKTAIKAGDKSVELAPGYYLLVDVSNTSGNTSDHKNISLLQVTNKETIKIEDKSDSPNFEKKIKDINDTDGSTSDWQDSADYDFGDDVPFRLQATLPTNFTDYKTYKVVFHDSIDANAFGDPENVKVYLGTTELASSNYSVSPVTTKDGRKEFTVTIENVKSIAGATNSSVIAVEYTAELQNTAALNKTQLNTNKAHLEYSNNPNASGEGETGKTPDDTGRAFTYTLDVNKIDKDGNALSGAGFTLYKKVKDSDGNVTKVKVGNEITGVTKFEFKGLDDGEYVLEETTTPAGYNTITPIEFKIDAIHDVTEGNPQLTQIEFTRLRGGDAEFITNIDNGTSTSVVNSKNGSLPETGGMGTTLIYTAGGLLVAGAAITYVTNKRMRKEN